jgi:hypothetical protein
MIPLRLDIWHNLERIFFAGVFGDELEVEADRYYAQYYKFKLLYNFS